MEVEIAECSIEKVVVLVCFVYMYRLESEHCLKKKCLEAWAELQQKKAEIAE